MTTTHPLERTLRRIINRMGPRCACDRAAVMDGLDICHECAAEQLYLPAGDGEPDEGEPMAEEPLSLNEAPWGSAR